MPLNAVGEIEYTDPQKGRVRYQADPPSVICASRKLRGKMLVGCIWKGTHEDRLKLLSAGDVQ
jgi:hypothetical protein